MASIISAGTTSGTSLNLSGDTSGVLQLASNGSTTAVTIDTSQNVGIGTSSPTVKFDVTGTVVASGLNARITNTDTDASARAAIQFKTGASSNVWQTFAVNGALVTGVAGVADYMRITSGGDVLIGGTTTIGDNGILLANADYTATYRSTSTAGAYIHAFASDNGGTRIVKYAIYANGTAGAVSDQNLKKNIEPARNYLDDLMNIEVVKYNWISDEENTPKELGCIAQQVETVFPGMVDEQTYKDGNGEEITQKMLKKEVFIPMMLKAIQELKTELDSVKTELDATKAEVQALKGTAL
jgi:hypothetical protein